MSRRICLQCLKFQQLFIYRGEFSEIWVNQLVESFAKTAIKLSKKKCGVVQSCRASDIYKAWKRKNSSHVPTVDVSIIAIERSDPFQLMLIFSALLIRASIEWYFLIKSGTLIESPTSCWAFYLSLFQPRLLDSSSSSLTQSHEFAEKKKFKLVKCGFR